MPQLAISSASPCEGFTASGLPSSSVDPRQPWSAMKEVTTREAAAKRGRRVKVMIGS